MEIHWKFFFNQLRNNLVIIVIHCCHIKRYLWHSAQIWILIDQETPTEQAEDDQARNLIFGMEYIFRNYTLEMPFRSQILKSRVSLISKQSKSDGRSRDTDLRMD